MTNLFLNNFVRLQKFIVCIGCLLATHPIHCTKLTDVQFKEIYAENYSIRNENEPHDAFWQDTQSC